MFCEEDALDCADEEGAVCEEDVLDCTGEEGRAEAEEDDGGAEESPFEDVRPLPTFDVL